MATDYCRVDFVETLKLAGTVLGALIASRTIWSAGRAWHQKGWGSRAVWRRKLNLLAIGATAEYVENLLGTPVFRNHQPAGMHADGEEKLKWVDHIFSTPHAWVVTRRIGEQLVSWSVTITDPKFWWELEDVTFGQAKGRLGRISFGDLLDAPSGKYELIGSRSGVYAESAYFGNPGAYQTYIFMHNEEGIGTYRPSGSTEVRVGNFQRPDDKAELPAPAEVPTRSETTVNSVIVTWHSDDIMYSGWRLWPVAASEQTRLLHRFQKKHGWQKKRYLGDGNGK